jgi:hypothetical protein
MPKSDWVKIGIVAFLFLKSSLGHTQDDPENIKKEILSCDNERTQKSYHLSITDDGRLTSYIKYYGESIFGTRVVYRNAKVSMEKVDGKCAITVREKVNKRKQGVRNLEFPEGSSGQQNFRYTYDDESGYQDSPCILSPSFKSSVGECNYSKDSYNALRLRDEDKYFNCKYDGPPRKVNPDKYNLWILDDESGPNVCLQRAFCQLKPGVKPEGVNKKPIKPYYNTWVSCLPTDRGVCNIDYRECREDPYVRFKPGEQDDTKIKKLLGMPTGTVQ